MEVIKRVIPLLLIALILFIVVYSNIADKKVYMRENIEDIEDGSLYEEIYGDEDRIIGLEKLLNYLDPFETDRYSKLLTLYSTYIPMTKEGAERDGSFYKNNEKMLRKVLGIYSEEDFRAFHEVIYGSDIGASSEVNSMVIQDVSLEKNLLSVSLVIEYDTDSLEIEHYINYVYIDGISNLFIYHLY